MDLYLVIFLILLVILAGLSLSGNTEKYYLRDIPFGLGYGGWPPGLYSGGFPYEYDPIGMYGAPFRYGERGYDSGAGLVW